MLLGTLQENLIVLLTTDEERAKIIRNTVELSLFGAQYRTIAARIYDYLDKYKAPPGQHLADILEDKLESEKRGEADLYKDTISSIYEAAESINKEYVMSSLETFVKRQSMRSIAIDLVKALQKDTEDSLEEADRLILKAQHTSLKLFDPGTRLSDVDKVLGFLDRATGSFPVGIPELDKRGLGPTRKEAWLFMANAKKGKTWALIQVSKMAIMQRLKVVHISLEVSEEVTSQRYFQTLFGMAKRAEALKNTKFKKDDLGRIIDFDQVSVSPKLSMDDPKIREKLVKRVDKWKDRILKNIIVKEFPTGSLTVHRLKAYLDTLEQQERFVPDLLVVDYPDLMKVDKNNLRGSLDEIYKDLRGIAVERNIALAIVTQANRDGAKAKTVNETNVAEAYSKIAHADTIISYSQTTAEKGLGLARLFVVAARNDEDKFTLVISQQYAMGNFVVDSTMMKGPYWENLPTEGQEEET